MKGLCSQRNWREQAVWHMRAVLVFLLVLHILWWPAVTRGDGVDIYKVKAAFLFNLSSFITWPDKAFPSSNAPLRFCVYGDTPTTDFLLSVIRGERVSGREIALEFPLQDSDFGRCHLLLLAEGSAADFERILQVVEGLPVLTVSSRTGFSNRGGMLTLSKRSNRLHPIINVREVKAGGIHISSKVLRLATIVDRDRGL
jgi:hypothetical protein